MKNLLLIGIGAIGGIILFASCEIIETNKKIKQNKKLLATLEVTKKAIESTIDESKNDKESK